MLLLMRGPLRIPLAVLAGILFVATFFAFVSANVVEGTLYDSAYYTGVINKTDAINRAYNSAGADPFIAGQLLDVASEGGGGEEDEDDILGELAGIVGEFEGIVAPFVLEEVVAIGIDNFIEYVKGHESLDLSLDVSGLVDPSSANGQYIHRRTVDGEESVFLGPPPGVQADIDEAFSVVHTVSWAAGLARAITAVLGIAELAFIALLAAPGPRRMLGWVGLPVLAAGLLGTAGWFAIRQPMEEYILSAVLSGQSTLARDFQVLLQDVVDQAVADLSPAFLIPSLAALVVGAVAVGASRLLRIR